MFRLKRTVTTKECVTDYETLDEALAVMDYEFNNKKSCDQIVIDSDNKIVYTPVEEIIEIYPEFFDYELQEV